MYNFTKLTRNNKTRVIVIVSNTLHEPNESSHSLTERKILTIDPIDFDTPAKWKEIEICKNRDVFPRSRLLDAALRSCILRLLRLHKSTKTGFVFLKDLKARDEFYDSVSCTPVLHCTRALDHATLFLFLTTGFCDYNIISISDDISGERISIHFYSYSSFNFYFRLI